MTAQLIDAARSWAAEDPDAATRAELLARIAAAQSGDLAALAELTDAFEGTLRFGTAGLRGKLGPGPNRMNLAVVTRAAAGVARYVQAQGGGAVVIGHDARRNSDAFARVTAQVVSGAGLPALVLPGRLPTPVLAYAVRYLGCIAGVMVTASHNPAQDNGYKVYLADGGQVLPPADAEISGYIDQTGPLASVPLGDHWTTLTDEVVEAYIARTVSLLEPGPPAHVRAAYTAMHGVGGEVFLRVMRAAGFPAPVVVTEQFEPDPDFGGMPFPNPEEPGAMDLAIARAREAEADLLVAHDPDADRCAVGIPGPDGPAAEGWRMLTGDEVGALLAWWIGSGNRRLARQGVFAQSIVSSSLLARIADDFHFRYQQTLTGFKWIARVPELTYGYEEALGYCVDPAHVRDKDGISAALMMIEMATRLSSRGRSLADVLDELSLVHGVHATRQVSVRVADVARIREVMASLRAEPPTQVGGVGVASFEDLAFGPGGLPPTDGLRLYLVDGSRIVVRPSGTEPKVKCYLQAIVQVAGNDVAAAHTRAEERLEAMARAAQGWLE